MFSAFSYIETTDKLTLAGSAFLLFISWFLIQRLIFHVYYSLRTMIVNSFLIALVVWGIIRIREGATDHFQLPPHIT